MWLEAVVTFWNWLTDSSRWPPRWACGDWHWAEVAAFMMSECGIMVELIAVGLVMWILLRRNPKLGVNPRLNWLLSGFFPLCGISHGMSALMFFYPYYIINLAVKILTAVTGAELCWEVLRSIKRIASYKSPEEFLEMIAELEKVNHQKNLLLIQRDRAITDGEKQRELLEIAADSVRRRLKAMQAQVSIAAVETQRAKSTSDSGTDLTGQVDSLQSQLDALQETLTEIERRSGK